MPYTKSQFDRWLIIHNKLATGQRYTFADLRHACTPPGGHPPSDKTLYNDLRELREVHGAPIPEKDRSGRPYYYQPGTSYSLHGALNPDDAALANEVSALLKQVAHLPQFDGLDDVFLKFEQRAGVIGKAQAEVVQSEKNRYYTGGNKLQPLYDAIRRDIPVLLTYSEFGCEPMQHQFSPYLLKEYHNRWHCYGWAAEAGRLLNLALDRISHIKPLPDLRRRPDTTNWTDHLADVIGFTRTDGEVVQPFLVRIWFPRAHYVLTKPLHKSQDVVQRTNDFVDLAYNLIWNREFEAALFELGPDAALLEPADKRADFAKKARRLAGRYAD